MLRSSQVRGIVQGRKLSGGEGGYKSIKSSSDHSRLQQIRKLHDVVLNSETNLRKHVPVTAKAPEWPNIMRDNGGTNKKLMPYAPVVCMPAHCL